MSDIAEIKKVFVGQNIDCLTLRDVHAFNYDGVAFVLNDDNRDIVDVVPGNAGMDVEWLDEENEISVFVVGQSDL